LLRVPVPASGSRNAHFLNALALACAVLVASVAVAYGGAKDPRLFAVAAALVCLPFVAYAAYLRPAPALAVSFVMVLLAGTKFRARSPTASLSGDVDEQIRFELAVFALLGLVVVLGALRRPALLRGLSTVEAILLGYVALAFSSMLWSPTPTLTLVRAGELAVLYALALISIRLLSTQRFLRMLGGGVLAYVLVCSGLSALFPWAGGGYTDYRGMRRFSWFSVHPILAATLVGLAALMVLSLALFGPRGWRERRFGIPVWLLMLPLLGLLAATNSRGPSGAFLAGACALVVRKHLRTWSVLALIAAAVALLVVFDTTGETTSDLLTQIASANPRVGELVLRGQTVQDLEGFNGRAELWRAAWPMLLARPVAGYGFQGSRAALLAATPWAAYAHNTMLQNLLDLGVLGTLPLWGCLAYCLFATARPMDRLPRDAVWTQGTVFAIAVFLVVNSVTTESFAGAPGFEWLLLLACILIAEQNASERGHGQRREEPLAL
jgi:O-antigen ligase